METYIAASKLEMRAAEALKALLGQVSAIKLKAIEFKSPGPGGATGILAHIDVYGHSHTLACTLNDSSRPAHLRMALTELCRQASQVAGDAVPFLIAPFLSAEAQALCKENRTGYLDLEGNARLVLNEVFFATRSLPNRTHHAFPVVNGSGSRPAAQVAKVA
jgi:hypothetical protein